MNMHAHDTQKTIHKTDNNLYNFYLCNKLPQTDQTHAWR